MRARMVLMFGVLGMGATVLTAATCSMPAAAPSPARSTEGTRLPPEDWWRPTPTPDLSRAVDPATGAARLAAVSPVFAAVLEAVKAGDVDGLLASVAWEDNPCGGEKGYVYCPGIPDGQPAPLVNVGESVPFWVTEGVVRPALEAVLAGEPLPLTLLAQLREPPGIYWVGFESATPRGSVGPPLLDPLTPVGGLLLWLDPTAPHPITRIVFVTLDWHAADWVRDIGSERFNITVMEPPPDTDAGATPAAEPAERHTGVEALDRVIDALRSGDQGELRPLVRYAAIACVVNPQGLGAPPTCKPDEPDGTIVQALPVGHCEGTYVRPEEIDNVLRSLGSREVYAAYRLPQSSSSGAEYGLVLATFQEGRAWGSQLWITAEDGNISGVNFGCAETSAQLLQKPGVGQVLLGPPPGGVGGVE